MEGCEDWLHSGTPPDPRGVPAAPPRPRDRCCTVPRHGTRPSSPHTGRGARPQASDEAGDGFLCIISAADQPLDSGK